MKNELNQVDLAFVVDTTGSMGAFIAAAQRQMIAMARRLAAAAEVDMRVGVVEYRDHPPQDRLVFRVHQLTDLTRAECAISGLRPEGGGDGPEAVLDGVLAACKKLTWRPHARRISVLVGDAPPHGVGVRGDGFPNGCPCGQTIESVTAAAERARVTLYGLALHAAAAESFARLAKFTGGERFEPGCGEDAIGRIEKILADEFGNLRLDAQVLAEWNDDNASIDSIAQKLQTGPGAVAASVTRLLARRLIEVHDSSGRLATM
jgi:von Willebrand factor type A domain